ncbi:MAG: trehalose 6-phosphate phosphatase [Frankiaceae bacterium]|nr:trehalose 6-phosphate phosphatase [Frankiaceae bacterium]
MLIEPPPGPARDAMAALWADPRRAVLASDYDGTLAPIVERPEDALPAPGAIEALRRLAPLLGRVVIVTGRSVESVAALAGLSSQPELATVTVLGHYGLERWEIGPDRFTGPEPDPGLDVVRRELPALLGGRATVEDKRHSIAVHTRSSTDPAGAFAELRDPLHELARRVGLEAIDGRLVTEIRPAGIDKGRALRDFVAEAPTSAVMFCGDDLGDLPAFEAVRRMRSDGIPGLTVASASDEQPDVAAAADLVVAGPEGIVGLLSELADRLGG